jgi:hypothetical protein
MQAIRPIISNYHAKLLSHPIIAPAAISQVELTLNHIIRIKEIRHTAIVKGSTREAFPSCQVTAAINPREATVMPSSSPLNHGDLRMRGMSGLVMATRMKEGRKIPSVASRAPGNPPSRYPIKVAVVKTGPGVTCPIAMESINYWSVSQP